MGHLITIVNKTSQDINSVVLQASQLNALEDELTGQHGMFIGGYRLSNPVVHSTSSLLLNRMGLESASSLEDLT